MKSHAALYRRPVTWSVAAAAASLQLFAVASAHAQNPVNPEVDVTRLTFAPVLAKVAESTATVLCLERLDQESTAEYLSMPASLRHRKERSGLIVVFGDEVFLTASHGSGLVADEDGNLITNHHVVTPHRDEDSGEYLGDDGFAVFVGSSKTPVRAELVGSDAATDIAVLKIPSGAVRDIAEKGNVAKLQVGDLVFAVGTPQDTALRQTATMGIVSALGRSESGMLLYEDFIQTDAAVNSGNSGGPLIDVSGKVVGFNQSIRVGAVLIEGRSVARSEGNLGIAFAVPADIAYAIKDQIVKHGRAVRGFLGLRLRNPSSAERQGTPRGEDGGAAIVEVLEGSPAEAAGLQVGDLLLQFANQEVEDADHLRLLVALTPPGREIALQLRREGSYEEVMATVADLAESDLPEIGFDVEPAVDLDGLEFSVTQPFVRTAFGKGFAPGSGGIVVENILPGSKTEEAGLRPGHVIVAVNGIPVDSVEELAGVLLTCKGGTALLHVSGRSGSSTVVVIPVD